MFQVRDWVVYFCLPIALKSNILLSQVIQEYNVSIEFNGLVYNVHIVGLIASSYGTRSFKLGCLCLSVSSRSNYVRPPQTISWMVMGKLLKHLGRLHLFLFSSLQLFSFQPVHSYCIAKYKQKICLLETPG